MRASSIFSNCERTDFEPRAKSVSQFQYLDTSSREPAAAIRSIIDDWLTEYPQSERNDWAGRFKKDDQTSISAFFELMMHQWLLQLGYSVSIHRETGINGRRPDFHLRASDGSEFWVEATTVFGETSTESRGKKFIEGLLDRLRRIESPDFFIDIEFVRSPTDQPNLGRVALEVEKYLRSLCYDDVAHSYECDHRTQEFAKDIDVEGFTFRISAIPKINCRGEPEPIGITGSEFQRIDTKGPQMSALRRKARQYGDLGLPFVIAINDCSEFAHPRHILDALLGETVVLARRQGQEVRQRRSLDGFFGNANSPEYTRVSAVLSFQDAKPWSFASCSPRLVHHPRAKYPVHAPLGACEEIGWKADSPILLQESKTMRAILGIPEKWPFIEK